MTDRESPRNLSLGLLEYSQHVLILRGGRNPEPGTIIFPAFNDPLITIKKASPGLMVVLCEAPT